MTNTTFPFYTSTAHQDANRLETPCVRINPRHKLMPFQIERSHNTSAVSSVFLVDCDGNKENMSVYFSSIGTTVGESSVGVVEFTSVDYIQYGGGALTRLLPYGVYYMELKDSYGTYYSEHFSVRDLQPNLLANYSFDNYDTFTTSGVDIDSAISTGSAKYAVTNPIDFVKGEKFEYIGFLILDSGQAPSVSIVDNSINLVSNEVQLSAGLNSVTLTTTKSSELSANNYLRIRNTAATEYEVSLMSLRKTYGDFIKIEFSNNSDLLHSKENDIMYSTGGFSQRVYLDTIMNDPSKEIVEVGEELNGEFISEKLNSTYLYNVVDYVSRSMFKGMSYLPLHENITITDEVGNEYSPDVGNVTVDKDSNTFDTFAMRIEFNDGSMTWVNDQEAIT